MIRTSDQKLFDKIALEYSNKDIYEVSSSARKFQINCLFELIEKKIRRKDFNNILEIGCGHGANSNYLNIKYNNYIGIDFSNELIKIANNTYKTQKRSFKCIDILDYEPQVKFDLVFGAGILHHISDINSVLQHLKDFGNMDTIYGFIEPQRGNPIIQLIRYLRKNFDKDYSADQQFFTKNELINSFKINDLEIVDIQYQGYFSPPFAQMILRPKLFMLSLVKIAIRLDNIIQNKWNNSFSWNLIFVARPKKQ